MKNLIRLTFCQAVLFSVVVLFAAKGVAQSTASDIATSQDCSKINLQVPDGESLTREEKIALLDQVLLDSLTSFEPCQSNGNDGTASGAGTSGGLEGAEGAEGEGAEREGASGTKTAMESTAVGDIQGDVPDSEASQETGAADKKAAPNKSAGDDLDAVLSSSEAPEDIPPDDIPPDDIPPVENDDIIAKQFRQAAIEETDPAAKAKLWNEYRRYKNLPVQEAPEN